ncbi:hypothetical protein CJF30_00005763 [Rutstroemia sp. NJR-2017a BBW]|nr:hypothetical protein CJF30_00005763 [Rutstroemia sp. NJR-2017a BBW]
MLERQGFVDIQEQVIKIPLNPWPTDSAMKDIARWYNLALTQGLEAMTLAPLTRVFNWTKDDVERLVADVKREICSRKVHVYNNISVAGGNLATNGPDTAGCGSQDFGSSLPNALLRVTQTDTNMLR